MMQREIRKRLDVSKVWIRVLQKRMIHSSS